MTTSDAHDEPDDVLIHRLLRAARQHLGLEIAFIGELHDGVRTFRYVDQASGLRLIERGASDPAESTYCDLVVRGELPEMLVDPAADPVAASLPVTGELPVGSHVSVPIRFSDGHVYGTFCCFSVEVHQDLDPTQLGAVRALADLAAQYLESVDRGQRATQARADELLAVLEDPAGVVMVYQPIVALDGGGVAAVEALARFPSFSQGPEWFFTEAARVGVGIELESHAVGLALARLAELPSPVRLNVNVSAETLVAPRFLRQLADVPPGRLVVEVTELSVIADYGAVQRARRHLEGLGVCLSIDDVGMGWSGLTRILECEPHQLKVDAAVTAGVHRHGARRALIEAFCAFARHADAEVVAEGIETEDDRRALEDIGVPLGQGYHLGRPTELGEALGAPGSIIDLGAPSSADRASGGARRTGRDR